MSCPVIVRSSFKVHCICLPNILFWIVCNAAAAVDDVVVVDDNDVYVDVDVDVYVDFDFNGDGIL